MKNTSLNLCSRNIEYIIDYIDCNYPAVSRRLTELGFVSGASLKVIQFSALKKTLLIEIHGYVLSLRESTASIVKVRK